MRELKLLSWPNLVTFSWSILAYTSPVIGVNSISIFLYILGCLWFFYRIIIHIPNNRNLIFNEIGFFMLCKFVPMFVIFMIFYLLGVQL